MLLEGGFTSVIASSLSAIERLSVHPRRSAKALCVGLVKRLKSTAGEPGIGTPGGGGGNFSSNRNHSEALKQNESNDLLLLPIQRAA